MAWINKTTGKPLSAYDSKKEADESAKYAKIAEVKIPTEKNKKTLIILSSLAAVLALLVF